MKRKVIASVVTVMIVLTVFGAVAISAAPTSSSASPKPDPYNVSIGEGMTWIGPLFNVHDTVRSPYVGDITSESSTGSKLATTVTSTTLDHSTNDYAVLGVKFHVKGINTQADWIAVETRPVTVTATVSYELTAKAGFGSTHGTGGMGIAESFANLGTGSVAQNGPSGTEPIASTSFDSRLSDHAPSLSSVYSPPTTVKFTTTLYALGAQGSATNPSGDAKIFVQLFNSAGEVDGVPVHITGTVNVYDIQLSWPSSQLAG